MVAVDYAQQQLFVKLAGLGLGTAGAVAGIGTGLAGSYVSARGVDHYKEDLAFARRQASPFMDLYRDCVKPIFDANRAEKKGDPMGHLIDDKTLAPKERNDCPILPFY